jgi:hypothetical protein
MLPHTCKGCGKYNPFFSHFYGPMWEINMDISFFFLSKWITFYEFYDFNRYKKVFPNFNTQNLIFCLILSEL